MADNQQSGEKTEDATPKKRQDVHKKGQAAKSTDLVQALSLLASAIMAPWVVSSMIETMLKALRSSEMRTPTHITADGAMKWITELALPVTGLGLMLIGVLMALGVGASMAQVGLMFSPEPLKPTWEKISPLAGAKRLFSKRALFEGLKALFKLFVFSWIVYAAVSASWDKLLMLPSLTPGAAAAHAGTIAQTIMWQLALTWLALAALDFFFQRKEFDNQIKMTKYELKQEMKEQEGSPEIRMARMQRRRRLAQGSLAKRLKEANVLVTNPTHFAVALKYDRSQMHAPMVVAKGQDYLALKMREIAADIDLPMVENRPLARALYKDCEPGDYVPRHLFAGVAEVLAYVYKTTQKVKSKAA